MPCTRRLPSPVHRFGLNHCSASPINRGILLSHHWFRLLLVSIRLHSLSCNANGERRTTRVAESGVLTLEAEPCRSIIEFVSAWIWQPRRTRKARRLQFDDLTHRVIGCAIAVYRALGPGFLESAYEQCLAHEFAQNSIRFKLQHPQPVKYKGFRLDCGYRIDLLVEDMLIVEIKERGQADRDSRSTIANIHETRRCV